MQDEIAVACIEYENIKLVQKEYLTFSSYREQLGNYKFCLLIVKKINNFQLVSNLKINGAKALLIT